MGGQNLQNSRSQSVTTISPQNAGTLKQKWVFTTKGDIAATPAVYDGTVYFPCYGGYFYAVDASNGALQWSRRVEHWTGVQNDGARDDPAIDGDTLILGDTAGARATWTTANGLTGAGARVIAVNRKTGALKWSTQVETFPAAYMTGSPVIYNGIVYIGVSSNEEAVAATQGYPCCAFKRKRRGARRSKRNKAVANLYDAQRLQRRRGVGFNAGHRRRSELGLSGDRE